MRFQVKQRSCFIGSSYPVSVSKIQFSRKFFWIFFFDSFYIFKAVCIFIIVLNFYNSFAIFGIFMNIDVARLD